MVHFFVLLNIMILIVLLFGYSFIFMIQNILQEENFVCNLHFLCAQVFNKKRSEVFTTLNWNFSNFRTFESMLLNY